MGSFKDIISSALSLKYVPEVMGNLLKLGKHTGVSWLHPGNTNKNVARGQDFCKDPQQPDSWMSGVFLKKCHITSSSKVKIQLYKPRMEKE